MVNLLSLGVCSVASIRVLRSCDSALCRGETRVSPLGFYELVLFVAAGRDTVQNRVFVHFGSIFHFGRFVAWRILCVWDRVRARWIWVSVECRPMGFDVYLCVMARDRDTVKVRFSSGSLKPRG